MKKNLFKLLVCLFICMQSAEIFSQIEEGGGEEGGGGPGGTPTITIFGDNTVTAGVNEYYTVAFSNMTVYIGSWTAVGGTITSQTLNNVNVTWNSNPGTLIYNVHGSSAGTMSKQFPVTVSTSGPSVPNTPIITSQNCTSATLQRGSPPVGDTWYWQGTNASGTSTSNSSVNYTVTSSGTYYLRARSSGGVWSSTSAYKVVSLGSIGAQVWYRDIDGDGLGDPNVSTTSCTQPSGYVANANDQCPTSHNNTSNGCPASQTLSNENYVYTIAPQIEVTNVSQLTQNEHAIKSVTYFDGLGRAKQSIGIKQSAAEKDIITHMEYDPFGRALKEYLPYGATASGGYMRNASSAVSETNSYYNTHYAADMNSSSPNPYSEAKLEDSPLNRVLEQAAPGKDWKLGSGHTIRMEYQANAANEVRYYNVTTSLSNNTYTPTLQGGTSYYPVGELTKVITKDENWIATDGKNHTIEEFTNTKGQMILKRNYNNSVAHDTYYVYDDFGNLTYVLTPKSEATGGKPNSAELDELCYQYKYDHRNRLVEKRIPGKEWDWIVYDKLDRPAMTKDAENNWQFTKYDQLGRVIYTGEFTDSRDRIQMQSHVDATNNTAGELYETKVSSGAGFDNTYYTNANFPTSGLTVYTVNYYDNYAFNLAGSALPGSITYAYGGSLTTNTKGLATGTRVRILGTTSWVTTVNYYDKRRRSVYIYSKNDFHYTTDIVQSKLDFTGKVEETTTNHNKSNDSSLGTQTIVDKFTYDHAGRLLTHKQKINSGTEEMIVSNTYDELGQLIKKGVGHTASSSTRLQNIDYKYNVRGWLKNINQDSFSDNDLFNFTIRYNDITDTSKKLFNGNISQTSWNTLNTNTGIKTYTYTYDHLNRITSGIANSSNYNLTSVSYDKNGNITTLQRRGHLNSAATSFGVMDNLVYTYKNGGNQLLKVLDNGNDTYGFKDGTNQTTEFTYDDNGNMKKDLNKGILNINYNHLNLPVLIDFGNNKYITYTYDAAGVKQRKRIHNSGVYTNTDYANVFVYENDALLYFTTPEGYFNVEATLGGQIGGDYVYQYKDHLGSIRMSYRDNNNNGSIATSEIIEENHYYPFGLKHRGYNAVITSSGNSTAQKRKFAGFEFQDELDLKWYDMTARNYDPSLGRWMNLDPLAEQMTRHSPYNYAFNNPIYFIDPDGMAPEAPKGGYGEKLNSGGAIEFYGSLPDSGSKPPKVYATQETKINYTYNKLEDGSHQHTFTETTEQTVYEVYGDQKFKSKGGGKFEGTVQVGKATSTTKHVVTVSKGSDGTPVISSDVTREVSDVVTNTYKGTWNSRDVDWLTGSTQQRWALGEKLIGPWVSNKGFSETLSPFDLNTQGNILPTVSVSQMVTNRGISANPYNGDATIATGSAASGFLVSISNLATPIKIGFGGGVLVGNAYRNFADHNGRTTQIYKSQKSTKID